MKIVSPWAIYLKGWQIANKSHSTLIPIKLRVLMCVCFFSMLPAVHDKISMEEKQ